MTPLTHSILIVGGTEKKRRKIALDRRRKTQGRQEMPPPTSRFDTIIIEPEENKQDISIKQIRGLQHQLALKPYHKGQKTAIIMEAQRLTSEAQNALLKTLEEPPAHSRLILTAPSTKNLLPTTVSRCQIVQLKDEMDIKVENENYQKAANEFWQILKWGGGERLEWSEANKAAINNRQVAIDYLNSWTAVLRDILLTKTGCEKLGLNPQRKSKIQERFLVRELLVSMNRIIDTKNLIESTKVSPRLAIEVLLLELPHAH